ncbi:hypothetical protein [Ancylobacter aquaticus]|uniref:hypothetical protein n=1 Tax=Ancylobacter aquaticus TaxID=100 RepID=UPI001042F77A|nr:hypothetical protein [Ancylobacter aquaticus]
MNRRNLIRGAALAPLLGALPAPACSAEADPSIIAVNAYKVARAAYVDACQRWDSDDEVDATNRIESLAAIAALSTVPTSPAGLRSLCEFASWLVSVGEAELSEWRPGYGTAGADQRTGEDMYFATLAAAAAALLPAAPQDMGTMPVCVPAPVRHDPLADMIRAFHDEEVVMRSFPGDIPEDFEHAAFAALGDEELPPALSQEVALDALRLSVRLGDEAPGDYAAPNLARAALAFFEGV